jgi:hypothetical protein
MPSRLAPAVKEATRARVYLLFAAVLAYFIVGLALRSRIGEVYPGLFMPGFPGEGIERVTPAEGQTNLLRIRVDFADGTFEWVPLRRFCGDTMNPFALARQLFLSRADAAARGLTVSERLAGLANAIWQGPHHASAPGRDFVELPADVQAFVAKRAGELFPGRTATYVTLEMHQVRVPLRDPQRQRDAGTVASFQVAVKP